ncbi:urease accessory protein UreD [Hymenobacter mucosus]|uniref:Urease accessory protein UreD n=1 Tax=Hymenobacter mucosus TaxID=1411120 RepID=A0A238W7Q2_9BACT|nr:urease accessory protein UreD [Hymenobacter mucosus]SNR42437.1 urease accessory protein [Hymenobacter mucosus]
MNVSDSGWSSVEVAQVRHKTQLITSKSIQPLKILNPASPATACHVMLSSYGGGMVAGDVIRLRVEAQAEARVFINTQSNTKIFRSTDGSVAQQYVVGYLADNSLTVVFPDPVVLQAESRYRQVQEWHLQPGALLLVADWFHSGRMDQGEQFAFTSLHTELKVRLAGRLVLLDRFTFQPTDHIATSPANFAGYQTMLSVYLVGSPEDGRFQQLADLLAQQQLAGSTGPHFTVTGHDYVVAITRAKPEVYLLRAAAHSRIALQPLCNRILAALANPELLGYNPWQRKY